MVYYAMLAGELPFQAAVMQSRTFKEYAHGGPLANEHTIAPNTVRIAYLPACELMLGRRWW